MKDTTKAPKPPAPLARRCDCPSRFELTEKVGTSDEGTEVMRCQCGQVHRFPPKAPEGEGAGGGE